MSKGTVKEYIIKQKALKGLNISLEMESYC